MSRLFRPITALLSFYQPAYAAALVGILEQADYSVIRYLARFWTTQDFNDHASLRYTRSVRNKALLLFVTLGALYQVLVGLVLLSYNLADDVAGAVPIGLALIISYPVVWAHLLALAYGVYKIGWRLVHFKMVGRSVVAGILEWQVRRLRRKHKFTLIAVAGSVGKTSTKLAIAHTLSRPAG